MAKKQRVPIRIGEIPAPTTFNVPGTDRKFRPPGRKYEPGLARKICERIAGGETLNAICSEHNMPNKQVVIKWLMQVGRNDFREMYYYARRVAAEILIDEVIEIADSTKGDWKPVYNRHGELIDIKADNEAIQRSRVRIDTRKWLAAKMIPRVYGENVEVTHGVTGKLAEMLQDASNQDSGPPALEGKANAK